MNAHPPADSIKPAICTIEGEQNLLGSLIVNPQSLDWIPTINAQDFYEPLHQQIFDVIRELRASDKKVSPITIQAFFPADRRVGNDMPLIAYLARLASEAIAIDRETVRSLAWTVLRKWVQRTAGNLSSELSLEMYDIVADADIEHMVGGAQEELGKIRDRLRLFQGQKIGRETMGDAMDLAISSIDEAYRFQKPCGISTGIEVVDNLTGPWEPGQQIIIGAGTKQGKTALAMQCAMGLAAHGPVWIYSGEMSSRQLAMREIARRTGIPVRLQKEGRISKQQWEEIARVRQDVGMLPVYVETRRMTLEQIRNEVTELKRKVGLASMIVDHVGLLNWPRQLANKDEWEQSQIATQTLKAIYSDLGVPGISLVQLKKNTFVISPMKNFKDKLNEAINRRPRYTDLLGAVERDADHVLIPFNARPIIAAIEPQEGTEDYLLWEDCMGRQAGKAEIILSLSRERFFPIRREVEWHGQTTSFGPEFKGKQETMF